MPKKKKNKKSIDSIIAELGTPDNEGPEQILRSAIKEHETVFNDITAALEPIRGKSKGEVTVEEKRLLYMRTEEAIGYLLHVKGDDEVNKTKYLEDLNKFKDTYRTRLAYIEVLVKLGDYIDSKRFGRDKVMDKWNTGRDAALKAISLLDAASSNANETMFETQINISCHNLNAVRSYFFNLYDRVLKPNGHT